MKYSDSWQSILMFYYFMHEWNLSIHDLQCKYWKLMDFAVHLLGFPQLLLFIPPIFLLNNPVCIMLYLTNSKDDKYFVIANSDRIHQLGSCSLQHHFTFERLKCWDVHCCCTYYWTNSLVYQIWRKSGIGQKLVINKYSKMGQDQKPGDIFFRLFTGFYAMHYTKRLATSFITKQTYLRVTCCRKVLNRSAGRMDTTYC